MQTYVVRVWLPDRPGALGQVASRIGAVQGDVIGIDILERGGGKVIDELVVALPAECGVDLLVAEMSQVDGVAVEDVQAVAADRPDPGLAALEVAAQVAEAGAADRLRVLCVGVGELVEADWTVVLDLDQGAAVEVAGGAGPDIAWLTAFIAGSQHLAGSLPAESTPSDLAWGRIVSVGCAVAAGRRARPFHRREREQVDQLCRLGSALIGVQPAVR